MLIDHESIPSDSLLDRDYTGQELEQVYFSAYQANETDGLPIFGFQAASKSNQEGSNLHQHPDHAWHASQDNDLGPDNVDICVGDIIQHDYEYILNLQYGYDCSSVDAGIRVEQQQCHRSLPVAFNVQHPTQQDIDDRL